MIETERDFVPGDNFNSDKNVNHGVDMLRAIYDVGPTYAFNYCYKSGLHEVAIGGIETGLILST